MALTRDQIFAARSRVQTREVDVPELGGSVLIRIVSLAEMAEVQRAPQNGRPETDAMRLYPKLIALACCNEDGTPLFVGEDVKLLGTLPWHATDTLARAILKFNRVGDEDGKKDRDGEGGEDEGPKASTP